MNKWKILYVITGIIQCPCFPSSFWFIPLLLICPFPFASFENFQYGPGHHAYSLASCLHFLNSIFDLVKAIVPDSLLQSFFIASLSIVLCLCQSPSFSSVESFLIVFPLWTHRMLGLLRKTFPSIWFDHTCSKQLRLVLKCISWLQQNIHCFCWKSVDFNFLWKETQFISHVRGSWWD